MKVRFVRWYNALLTALLGMLGYGCSTDDPMDEYGVILEYGVPNADYVIKGAVTNEAGSPIPGIKAKLTFDRDYGIDSTLTDASGRYEVKVITYPELHGIQLVVEDIDGEANGGLFQSDTLDLSKMKPTQVEEGNNHWYRGKFELTADVQMKKAE